MAKLELYGLDPAVQQLNRMGRLDEIAPKMIDAAMPRVVAAMKAMLQSHRDTGGLINSVKAGKAKATKNGGYIGTARFVGYESGSYKTDEFPRGKPHAVKAMGLEYGSSNEAAQPFMDKAMKQAEPDAMKTMQEVFEEEVGR